MGEWATEVSLLSMRALVARIRRKLARIGAAVASRPPSSRRQAIEGIQRNPGLLVPWLDLIRLVKDDFPDSLREQVLSHDITRSGVILYFKEELQNRMAADLQQASRRLDLEDPIAVCCDVAAEMIRLKTIAQCRDAHAEGNYYRDAEPYIQKQWDGVIWPIIKGSRLPGGAGTGPRPWPQHGVSASAGGLDHFGRCESELYRGLQGEVR
jgi:hypothetical protein